MAQVNLLPSTKQDNLKSSRLRQIVITTGAIVLLGAIAVPIILFASKTTQGLVLKRVQGQINDNQKTINNTPNIETMLTMQTHLASLPALYAQRLLVSDLFKILPSVITSDIHLSSLKIATDGSIEFVGTSNSYQAVNKFFSALQLAGTNSNSNQVNTAENSKGQFSNLVLVNVSGPSGGQVSFSIKGNYAQSIITGGGNGQ